MALKFKFELIYGGLRLVSFRGLDRVIEIPNTHTFLRVLEIGERTFSKSNVNSVVLPRYLTSIPTSAFSDCYQLKFIEFNPYLTRINSFAFLGCTRLSEVIFPNSVNFIGEAAFSGCSKLTEVVLPNSINFIGEKTFYECFNLKKIISFNPSISVADNAFEKCDNVSEASFVFWKCFSRDIQLRLLYTQLDKWESFSEALRYDFMIFVQYNSLYLDVIFSSDYIQVIIYFITSSIPLDIAALDRYINFSVQRGSSEITASLLEYRNKHFSTDEISSFFEHSELVEFGFSVPSYHQLASSWEFLGDSLGIIISGVKRGVTSGVIPAATSEGFPVVSIVSSSFNAETRFSFLNPNPFDSTYFSLEHLIIEANITSLPVSCFRGCSNLISITLPDSLVEVGSCCFFGCSSLTEIVFPPNISVLDNLTFYNCSSLRKIVFPQNLKKFNTFNKVYGSFIYCDFFDLAEIVIPSSFGDVSGIKQFFGDVTITYF